MLDADLPPHYLFFIGGSNRYYIFPDRQHPFLGLRVQERRGRYVQIIRAGLQYQFVSNVFAQVRWNAGETFDEWIVDFDEYTHGYGLILGARTPFGPITLTFSETELDKLPRIEIDVGYAF